VAGACAGLAQEHRSTPMAARTLLQQALPTTFGLKAAGWLVAVLDARARLSTVRRDGLAAQLGGAAGTLASLGDEGLATARYFAEEVGLPEPVLPWHTSRGRVAELGAALAVLAGVSGKIALDVCLLAQTEVGEVREAEGRGGSSTLPHKRNPVGAVLARSCAELARMHASVLGDALSSEHERAAGGWQAEWDALSGALAYAGAAAASVAEALEGLEVDAERMRRNLDATGGLVVSEALAVVLAERLGRVEAHDLVREAAARAATSGRPFRDEVLEDRRAALSPEEVDAALDPAAYLGSAEALVGRALERWTAERGGA
jgi:3-carboxy-cis,cis-muconate cycloisomerase